MKTMCRPALAVLWATLVSMGTVHASQSYPSKPVRLVVASGIGGGLDFVARLVAPKMSEALGHSVVVDNRAGASGTIAAELTARAAPDGYSLIMLSASLVVYATVNKTGFDIMRDFAPISQVTASPYVLVVNPALAARSVTELASFAKANPQKLNYASTGNATLNHLAMELFASSVGARMVHVPYKGLGAAYPDLLSGQVQLTFAAVPSALPHIRSQRLRALAVTSAVRIKATPELPTMIEAGVPGFIVTQWHGMLAPRHSPTAVIDRLQQVVASVLRQPDVAARLAAEGSEPVGSTPQEFGAHLKAEQETWSRVVQTAGIRPE